MNINRIHQVSICLLSLGVILPIAWYLYFFYVFTPEVPTEDRHVGWAIASMIGFLFTLGCTAVFSLICSVANYYALKRSPISSALGKTLFVLSVLIFFSVSLLFMAFFFGW